uniref:Uncharacterized protein n=1 Tax=viral metagenome TaxID=1070528 RepID=A0A6C0ACZ6_9ZZZZ
MGCYPSKKSIELSTRVREDAYIQPNYQITNSDMTFGRYDYDSDEEARKCSYYRKHGRPVNYNRTMNSKNKYYDSD